MSITPLYDKATPDTTRGLTASVWRQSLEAYVSNNPAFGTRIQDDFKLPVLANTTDASVGLDNWWLQDSAAGGTAESATTISHPDGQKVISATTGTDHFGISTHLGTTATSLGTVYTPFYGGSAASTVQLALRRGRVVYETRVDLTNLDQFFIGLTEPIVDFLSATSALPTDSDYIGFYRNDAGALRFVMANDNNAGTALTDEITLLTAAEMVALQSTTAGANMFKLAFAINDQPTGISYDVAVNGVWYGSGAKTLNPLACPIEALTPKYEVTRGATGDRASVSLAIDSIDVFNANNY